MIDREVVVGDNPVVRLTIRFGDIKVEGGRPGVIQFLADSDDPTFEIRERPDAVAASTGRMGGADITVRVPDTTALEIETTSADVDIEAPVSRIEVFTVSGDIGFATTGQLRARTASGDIRGDKVTGEATCVTASGDIHLSEVEERAELSSASGDVRIRTCAGRLICSTISGDVRIDQLTGPEVEIRSMAGGVRLGIPAGTRVDFDGTTMSGEVRLPSPSPNPDPPQRETQVKVRLVSGDLTIERA